MKSDFQQKKELKETNEEGVDQPEAEIQEIKEKLEPSSLKRMKKEKTIANFSKPEKTKES